MREIKFRVFKTFGLPRMKMDYNPVIYKGMYCDMDGSLICDTYESDTAILMQYTGLKDANGKEIYEGDIVVEAYKGEFSICLTTFEKKPLKSGTYEVKWNKIGFNLGSEDGRDYEVIGNIYEDSHLLLESNGQVK